MHENQTHDHGAFLDRDLYRSPLRARSHPDGGEPGRAEASARNPDFRLTFARLVTHYWSNGCFLAENA
jgi:hypothetical protein